MFSLVGFYSQLVVTAGLTVLGGKSNKNCYYYFKDFFGQNSLSLFDSGA